LAMGHPRWPSVATYKANAIDKAVPSARRQAIRNPRQIRISAGCFQYRYCPASDFFASCGGAPPVPRSSIPFLWASYSGVPGRGGTPFGRPPAHSGIISIALPTLASYAPLAQEASAVPRINKATRRIMTTDEGTFSIRANYGKLKFKLGHCTVWASTPSRRGALRCTLERVHWSKEASSLAFAFPN